MSIRIRFVCVDLPGTALFVYATLKSFEYDDLPPSTHSFLFHYVGDHCPDYLRPSTPARTQCIILHTSVQSS